MEKKGIEISVSRVILENTKTITLLTMVFSIIVLICMLLFPPKTIVQFELNIDSIVKNIKVSINLIFKSMNLEYKRTPVNYLSNKDYLLFFKDQLETNTQLKKITKESDIIFKSNQVVYKSGENKKNIKIDSIIINASGYDLQQANDCFKNNKSAISNSVKVCLYDYGENILKKEIQHLLDFLQRSVNELKFYISHFKDFNSYRENRLNEKFIFKWNENCSSDQLLKNIDVEFSGIVIIEPKRDTEWKKGETYRIIWGKSKNNFEFVKIRLYDISRKKKILEVSNKAENNGYYLWKVPEDIKSNKYCIRVKTIDNKDYYDSDIFEICDKDTSLIDTQIKMDSLKSINTSEEFLKISAKGFLCKIKLEKLKKSIKTIEYIKKHSWLKIEKEEFTKFCLTIKDRNVQKVLNSLSINFSELSNVQDKIVKKFSRKSYDMIYFFTSSVLFFFILIVLLFSILDWRNSDKKINDEH